jgi:hypothetical protein
MKFTPIIVGIDPGVNGIPATFALEQNYPNPFNPGTAISYQLPVDSYVKLRVYDIVGKEITVLVNEKQDAGRYQVEWNAKDYPSGVYFYKLETANFTDTKKMMLIK